MYERHERHTSLDSVGCVLRKRHGSVVCCMQVLGSGERPRPNFGFVMKFEPFKSANPQDILNFILSNELKDCASNLSVALRSLLFLP